MRIWLDERKGLVLGRTKWTGGAIHRCKTIGGYRYLRSSQTASWPLTLGTLHRLRDAFGHELDVDPKLYQWARLQQPNGQTPSDPWGIAADVDTYSPKLGTAIRSRHYQVQGVKRVAAQSRLLLADEPSLGKTLQSIGGLMAAGEWHGRHLVICPKTAINSTWSRQIMHWTDGQVFPITGSKTQKQLAIKQFLDAGSGARIAITNPETLRVKLDKRCDRCAKWKEELVPAEHEGRTGHELRWRIRVQDYPELFGIPWTSIIADECDRYLLALRPQAGGRTPQWGEGLKRLDAEHKIAMTGTPFHGSEISLFGILHWLDPVRFSAFWTFVDQYFEVIETRFGREIGGIRLDSREAFNELLDQYTLRRTKLEVKPDLPPELHQDHYIDMTPAQERAYENFEVLGWTRLQDEERLRSNGVLAQLTRLQQLAFGEMMIRGDKLVPVHSEKLEWLMDALAERGIKVKGLNTGHMKYVIVSRFTFVLNWLEEKLNHAGIATVKITGEVTGRHRDNAVAGFQEKQGPRVMLLNTTAGGVSIDLDAWCDEMFILDETFVEDEMVQVRGRINNRGERVAPRTFHYLRSVGTIEERMADENLRQALMQHELLDGRRGLEMAARLMGRQL